MSLKSKVSIAGILLAIFALQGCRHPLAITGEGDIVDTNNSGHGCTLEQFQAQDTACTENEVSGDYFVNYKAEPRPGWRFVRWDGPCAPDSDFQYCHFNVSEDGVAWWDETYPDAEIPSSTAVFELISGLTGFLTDSVVAGVAYETPTQTGVTGLDGSFQYAAGETVRFMIGQTLLGEVTGQEEVTPFELAGSPVQTGIDITWALQDEYDPFQAVTNIAVFLQSLDHDDNPDNGIEIRPGVASLLHKVKLDLHQTWDAFQDDPTFHHMIGRANREHRFSVSHGIVNPAVALDRLYDTLEIDPRTVGLTLLRTATREGESTWEETVESFSYDVNGNLTRHTNSDYGEDAYESWQYDLGGKVIRHETYASQFDYFIVDTWQYDLNGNLVTQYEESAVGDNDEMVSYLYDADSNPIRAESVVYRDEGNVEQASQYLYDYDRYGRLRQYKEISENEYTEVRAYDANGNLTGVDFLDGSVNYSQRWKYDGNGNLTKEQVLIGVDPLVLATWEYNADGNPTRHESEDWVRGYRHRVETLEYDANGNVTLRKAINPDDSSVLETETWQYDTEGKVIRKETDWQADGTADGIETWQYDDSGRITVRENYFVEGGFVEESETWQYHPNGEIKIHQIERPYENWRTLYDSNGNLTREEIDHDGNGKPDSVEIWEYDLAGNLTRRELNETGNDSRDWIQTYQYVLTEWGHLFSGIEASFSYVTGQPLRPRPDYYE